MLDKLRNLGLTELQVKIYLKLLDFGKAGLTKLAHGVDSYKANVYGAVEKLIRFGFVSEVWINNRKKYIPTDPKNLPKIIAEIKRQKNLEFLRIENEVLTQIPLLSKNYSDAKETEIEKVDVFHGPDSFKTLITDEFKVKGKIFVKIYGNFKTYMFKRYNLEYHLKKGSYKVILPRTKEILEYIKISKEHSNIRLKFVDKEQFSLVSWMVTKTTFVIIIWSQEPTFIRIRSKAVADRFNKNFDTLWKYASAK